MEDTVVMRQPRGRGLRRPLIPLAQAIQKDDMFLEHSACMHFGSRRPAQNRYQWQFSFTSSVRNDFMELWRPRRVFSVRESDSPLRRLVLDSELLHLD